MLQELEFRRLVALNGRRGRLSYLIAFLAIGLAFDRDLGLAFALRELCDGDLLCLLPSLIIVGTLLTGVWVGIATMVQRLHDLNRSGWLVLVAFPLDVAEGVARVLDDMAEAAAPLFVTQW
jgi:uncharacterized membrane protein YhaH (DUF805 family)